MRTMAQRTDKPVTATHQMVDALAWAVLGDDPADILASIGQSAQEGASPEQLARAVAYAAALRLDPLPRPERPWRLGRRPPRFHQPPTPSTSHGPRPHAGAAAGYLSRGA